MSDSSSIRPAPTSRSTLSISRPRYGKVASAAAYSGIGRSKLYDIAGDNPGLFRKSGATTLVDFEFLDRILDALPVAEIKPRPNLRRGEIATRSSTTRT